MGKIAVLDEHIANQIAAGEVVERPSSVVKELVENAIDAGATKIEVFIEEGGLELIRVIDNGSGIEPEDCEAAFYRHATSKIASGRDLFQIRSLGFRGEALPSIASVSKVRLLSSNNDTGLGQEVVIEGGTLKENAPTATPQGTDVTIKELFYNTPARLKYMKTIQTELGHVSDVMYRQALAHPEIAFILRHNDNTLLQTQGSGDLLQVIASIYGVNTSKKMVPIKAENLDYKLEGYIGLPELTRSNRGGISTIVNGRYVRNQGLHQAMLRAYHTMLPINRYPITVLMLDMHPSLVDVNVHPAKLEVRFSKEAELNAFVENSIRSLLSEQVLIPQVVKQSIGRGDSKSIIQEQFHFPASRPNVSNEEKKIEVTPTNINSVQTQSGINSNRGDVSVQPQREINNSYTVREAATKVNPSHNINRNSSYSDYTSPQVARTVSQAPEALYRASEQKPEIPAFPELTLIGQHHGTYLIAQNEQGLYLIDQHAAHERINYEYYYEKFGHPADASQELLLPITLEFTSAESEKIKERLPWFEKAGVILEHFGGGTFRVVAHPYWFPSGEEAAIIEEMAEWVLSERSIDLAKLREKSSILVSCKASIKANQKLTPEEADTLLRRLGECKQPYTCPHGRPIVVSFSTYDLEKLFKRVM